MKSTEGLYFSRLDHVRAFAAYLVFVWHFLHITMSYPVLAEPGTSYPVPMSAAPIFPLSIFEEGHTGVALFMTLSGYLFAKLVGDHRVNFVTFLWSRAVRLAPLLFLCLFAGVLMRLYAGLPIGRWDLLGGFIFPSWPRGAWSITVELHFYLIFPLLMFAVRRAGSSVLLLVLVASIAFKAYLWQRYGTVQDAAYWTIIGHIDQFLLGMFFARLSLSRGQRFGLAIVTGVGFLVFWQIFNAYGGFFTFGGYPSRTPLWIVLPAVEGLAYASFILWYEHAKFNMPERLDRWLSNIGAWSYSIYLLHMFLREGLAVAIGNRPGSDDNFGLALVASTALFVAFLPVAAASYRWIETPFLKFRRPYLVKSEAKAAVVPA